VRVHCRAFQGELRVLNIVVLSFTYLFKDAETFLYDDFLAYRIITLAKDFNTAT